MRKPKPERLSNNNIAQTHPRGVEVKPSIFSLQVAFKVSPKKSPLSRHTLFSNISNTQNTQRPA